MALVDILRVLLVVYTISILPSNAGVHVEKSFTASEMGSASMASCSTHSPKTYKAENGSKITYCEFHGEKKYPGETWVAEDHENCSCDVKEGLKCCKGGQHHYSYTNVNGDSDCVEKKQGSKIKWVNSKTWKPCKATQKKGDGSPSHTKSAKDLDLEYMGAAMEDFHEILDGLDNDLMDDDAFEDFNEDDIVEATKSIKGKLGMMEDGFKDDSFDEFSEDIGEAMEDFQEKGNVLKNAMNDILEIVSKDDTADN